MPKVTFEIPDEMADTAVAHVNDLAHVRGLTVISADGEMSFRESEDWCPCGRRYREQRDGDGAPWVHICPVHGIQGGGVA